MTEKKTRKPKTKTAPEAQAHTETKNAPRAASFYGRVTEGFRDARAVLTQARGLAREEGRTIALKLIEQTEENINQGFETLRAVVEAKSFTDAVRIQQQAVGDTFRRNLKQMREVSELVTQGGTKALKPVRKFVTSLRAA